MKFTILSLASMLILPTLALAQGEQARTKPDGKAPFDVMKANVAKITEAGEKERWQANLDLWQLKLAQTGAVAKTELDKMAVALDRIKANVAKVTEAGEKRRWQANLDLWQVVIAQKGVPAKGDVEKLKAPFEKMKANVAKVTAAGEKEALAGQPRTVADGDRPGAGGEVSGEGKADARAADGRSRSVQKPTSLASSCASPFADRTRPPVVAAMRRRYGSR